MIAPVPTRRDEERLDHAENQGRTGVPAAVLLGVMVALGILWWGLR